MMTAPTTKSLLVIVRHTPYGSSLARSSIEVALTSATFNQTVAVLFMGHGVLQLLPEQKSDALGVRNIAKLITSFPLYDLNNIFVDQDALEQHGLEKKDLIGDPEILSETALQDLMHRYDHIVGF
jgi:tRNA 2-thiouridine synthesizing protein C